MIRITFSVVMTLGLLAVPVQGGDNRLVTEGVVDASLDEVWDAFTTKKGFESWCVAHAEFEWKVGGKVQAHYSPQGKIGDAGTIEHTILSFDPKHMYSFKTTGLPKGFPYPKAMASVWVVLYIDEAGPKQARVKLVMLGFGDDEESQKCRAFFEKGNAYSMKKLQEHFKP